MATAHKPPAPALKIPKTPTPAHRRALLAALADDKGRVPQSTDTRVLDAICLACWVTAVTNTGRAAASARWAGYDGPVFHALNSRGRRALLTDAGNTALRSAGPDGRLPEDTSRPTVKTLHRDGLVEFRDGDGTTRPNNGDDGVRGPLHAPYVTELGRRLITGFPQSYRSA
ncbi:hypothetical protein GCM10010218_12460 [Streptomyces mashuensis]|uniref:Uncharacterized protein n=1 Tax=Streptomyces mashuensis TaxID=33904 RepID=A0A919AYT8_9ACTN|nr:hypothetical protein [Streptomyces mashuensis]GHF32904.1 hypothetical protein GCM10010218_12460 [Streptomyces mashuensis]